MGPTKILRIDGMPEFDSEEQKQSFFNEAGGSPQIASEGETLVLTYETVEAAEEASSLIKETADSVHGTGVVTVEYAQPGYDLNLSLNNEEAMETTQAAETNGSKEPTTTENAEATAQAGDAGESATANQSGNAEEENQKVAGDTTDLPSSYHLQLPAEERVPEEIFRPLDYIPPTAESIANISFALWTHPSFYIKTLNLMESLDLPDPCNSGPIKDLDPGSEISHFVKVFPVARRGPQARPPPQRPLPSSGPFDRALIGRIAAGGPGPMSTRQRMLEQQLGVGRPGPMPLMPSIGRRGIFSAPYPQRGPRGPIPLREGGGPNDRHFKDGSGGRRRGNRAGRQREMMLKMQENSALRKKEAGEKPDSDPASASEAPQSDPPKDETPTDFAADDAATAATF